jgi:hypothetical protein
MKNRVDVPELVGQSRKLDWTNGEGGRDQVRKNSKGANGHYIAEGTSPFRNSTNWCIIVETQNVQNPCL